VNLSYPFSQIALSQGPPELRDSGIVTPPVA
jgi:hypothetical protein